MPASSPLFDQSIWRPSLPAFAPLPEVFIEHIWKQPHALKPFPEALKEPLPLFDQVWMHIQIARRVVSHRLVTAVKASGRPALEREWFQKNFDLYAEVGRKLPRTSMQEWIRKRLLRSLEDFTLEANSVSALYMMRYLFRKDYFHWLPPRQKPDAPWFYVWGISPGDRTPRIYPYPLPREQVAPNTLFWTQWLGAAWMYPGWISVPGIGSLAWGKIRTFEGSWYWDLSEEEMAVWDASFVREVSIQHRHALLTPIFRTQHQGFPDAEEYYMLTRTHQLANLLLQHLGEPILADYIHHSFHGNAPTSPYIPF